MTTKRTNPYLASEALNREMLCLKKNALFWKIIAGVLAVSVISETAAIFKWLGVL
jgi:hypothetical protein